MISATVGEVFGVRLTASPTTGYRWHAPDLPDGLELVDSGFTPVADAQPGDGGTEWFRLRATRPGHHDLTFHLKRPWEQTTIDSHVVSVEVTES